jgi:hypothetical protein
MAATITGEICLQKGGRPRLDTAYPINLIIHLNFSSEHGSLTVREPSTQESTVGLTTDIRVHENENHMAASALVQG